MEKRGFFILFAILFLSFWGAAVLAQTAAPSDRPLEVKYPSLPQITTPPTTVATPIAEYVKYVYYFFLFAAGFFALGALVYASFRYITSAGRPEAMKDAKDQISAAIFGVVILFSSWIILNQINPKLTTFTLGPLRPAVPTLTPGVLLCTEEIKVGGIGVKQAWDKIEESKTLNKEFDTASADRQKEIITSLSQISNQVNAVIASTTKYCWPVPSASDIPNPFNDKVEWAYLIPAVNSATSSATSTAGSEYGAILYENTKFGGKSLAIYTLNYPNLQASEWAGILNGKTIKDLHPSSIKPFILNYEPQPRPIWYVNLYELVDWNKADPNKWKKEDVELPTSGQAAKSSTIGGDQKLGSLKIEGSLFVVFFKESASYSGDNKPWEGEIDVFTESDTNLYDNIMGRWCSKDGVLGKEYFPCAPGGLVVISGGIY